MTEPFNEARCNHWTWCVAGFQGLVGMLAYLNDSGPPAPDEALKKLEEYHNRLGEILKGQTERHDNS